MFQSSMPESLVPLLLFCRRLRVQACFPFAANCRLACLLLLAVLVPQALADSAPVFYVSPNGNDSQSGLSPAQAWQTLARAQQAVNTGAFATGGELRLACGATFRGGLAITNLTLAAPTTLIITAYGEGPPPVITGLLPLTEWQGLGNGRWRALCPTCTAMPNVLTRDGVTMPLARWPNLDEPSRGYLFYESFQGRTSITDEQLPPNPDWTGGEVVLRTTAWKLDRLPIASHRGQTLTFATLASGDIQPGYGYFIQNHPAALDQDGEWVYDSATRSITVFLSRTTPAEHQISVATAETLLSVSRSQGLVISDLRLAGARRANIEVTGSSRITVSRVQSWQAGDVGARCLDCRNLLIEDSHIDAALNHGLDVFNCTDCLVERNQITNIATVAGLGRSGDGQYNGVRFGGANAVFARNQVARTGYLGIDARGAATIRQNIVSEFNLVKTDGGGIYTWGNRDVDIIENLVLNGAGSKVAVPWNYLATHGIYIDDQSEQVNIRGNTIQSVGSNGINLHNTRLVNIEENTVVDAGDAQIAYDDDNLGSYTVTENSVRANVFVSTQPGAMLARASTTGPAGFFKALGSMTGNRYCAPFTEPLFGSSLEQQRRMFFSPWQLLVGTDADSQLCPQRYPACQVKAVTGPNRVQNGQFNTDLRGWFGWPDDALRATWNNGRLELRHTGQAPIIHYDTDAGQIAAGQFYRIRFKANSDQPNRLLRVYLRKWDPDYRFLGEVFDLPLGDQPRQYEVVVGAAQTEARSLLIFELPNSSQVVWLDDVELQTVDAEPVDRAGLVRVETNPAATPLLVTLDEDYTDAAGQRFPAGSRITIKPWGSQVLFRTRIMPLPAVAPGGVVNGASFQGPSVAPGSIVSLFGAHLGATAAAGSLPLPTQLGGASVSFGGVAAALFYVSGNQINAQVPFETVPGTARATVVVGGGASPAVSVSVVEAAPGIFTQDSSGKGAGVTANAVTGQLVTASTPIQRGQIITIYGTGFGPVSPQAATGAPSPTPAATTTKTVTATVGGLPATVLFAGLTPGLVGLYQLNVQVPSSCPTGSSVPVVATVSGVASNTVTIAIQ